MEVHHRLLESQQYQMRRLDIEAHISRYLLFDGVSRRKVPTAIPVVVHVVHSTDDEDVSDEQVQSQIDALNRDYSCKNQDQRDVPSAWRDLIGNPMVRFELAKRDPQGKSTAGITRTSTKVKSFATDDHVKMAKHGGCDPWDSAQYLNLWVCALGGGLLGYAQFPGGPPETDGVVILYSAFGTTGTATAPYNLGRTATHEVGHWLDLFHIWGDRVDCNGTDYVSDTPPAQAPNYGKPRFPHITCNNGPNGDLFVNYMDYVDDDTMVMFTRGQVARIAATLDGPRAGLGSGDALAARTR
jgi:hypothetical protein